MFVILFLYFNLLQFFRLIVTYMPLFSIYFQQKLMHFSYRSKGNFSLLIQVLILC